jgi:hypothetical protein
MNIKHTNAALIIDGTIISGIIYEHDVFQAGVYSRATGFEAAWPNPLTGNRDEACMINVAGIDFDQLPPDSHRQPPLMVAKLTKNEAHNRAIA